MGLMRLRTYRLARCTWEGLGLNIPSDAETPYVVADMAELAAHLSGDKGR